MDIKNRFDGIKYDVKKIEEVVYDITLRGLHQPNKKRDLDGNDDSNDTLKLKKTK